MSQHFKCSFMMPCPGNNYNVKRTKTWSTECMEECSETNVFFILFFKEHNFFQVSLFAQLFAQFVLHISP